LQIRGGPRTLASFPRRFGAYVLDTAPFAVLWTVILATTDRPVSHGRGLAIVGWLTLFIGYFTVAIAHYGRTLGMWMARICVVSADTGENPRWLRSLLRALVQMIARPTPPLAITGPIAALVYGPLLLRHRRGLHDLLARTVVIDAHAPANPQEVDIEQSGV
jgi:uncharacterized RDD family membrane protein YckC